MKPIIDGGTEGFKGKFRRNTMHLIVQYISVNNNIYIRKPIASIQCPIITLGNARVIYPGISACIDCTLDLFPPQINFPLCTIAHTPRLPEHCIEYVRMLLWNKENPFTKEGEFYRLRAYKNPF